VLQNNDVNISLTVHDYLGQETCFQGQQTLEQISKQMMRHRRIQQ